MKLKTSELTGHALDWAVHVAMHGGCDGYPEHSYSADWSHGGPLIEREEISLDRVTSALWVATRIEGSSVCESDGPTQLVAVMRCYVASVLGAEIDVPDELV